VVWVFFFLGESYICKNNTVIVTCKPVGTERTYNIFDSKKCKNSRDFPVFRDFDFDSFKFLSAQIFSLASKRFSVFTCKLHTEHMNTAIPEIHIIMSIQIKLYSLQYQKQKILMLTRMGESLMPVQSITIPISLIT